MVLHVLNHCRLLRLPVLRKMFSISLFLSRVCGSILRYR
nr:MAG TPA: hypothetical protein [Microviridae sp.]